MIDAAAMPFRRQPRRRCLMLPYMPLILHAIITRCYITLVTLSLLALFAYSSMPLHYFTPDYAASDDGRRFVY